MSDEVREGSPAPGMLHPELQTQGQGAGPDIRDLPIGVFDSGVGGLTVLRQLQRELPGERFIYLGDTARLPYGTKSADSVLRYSLQAARFLHQRGIKYLVIACNTASAVAVTALRDAFAPVPVCGVIEPGSAAGCAASKTGAIAVIATEATVQGGAYQRTIATLNPRATVLTRACSLFVALAEEGWTDGPLVEGIAHRYLDELLSDTAQIDTLLLGCTHFPMLEGALRNVVGERIVIVDSAHTTAQAVAGDLRERALLNPTSSRPGSSSKLQFLATDGAQRFARVGSRFLGEEFGPAQVELVDLNGP